MAGSETLIVEMQFGSRLYGTATVDSDLDYKAVFIPSARDILLQRVQPVVYLSRSKLVGARNTPDDIDREMYSLQRYLELLADGQMVAIDMLFAPDAALTHPPSSIWQEIRANTHRLITRKSEKMLRYCQQQAIKYGFKGTRLAAARQALDTLRAAEATYGGAAKLALAEQNIRASTIRTEHIALVDLPGPGGSPLRHLEVAGRKAPMSASIKSAREMIERLVAEYGERAHQAERNEGVDWKALSHAVRVGREAIDLLTHGSIQFPLAYAEHLLAIKRGELSYSSVRDEIEQLLLDVETAARTSPLRQDIDLDFMEDLISRAYQAQVQKEFGHGG